MKIKSINEILEKYDIHMDKIVKTIKKEKVKNVLLQFPDGMKPYSTVISKEIENISGCKCFIWFGTCFGACDIPIDTENIGIDLIIQFGHSSWEYKDKKIKVLKIN
jgi:2-(3-amino-3-carboxypropyl)histidine synthase